MPSIPLSIIIEAACTGDVKKLEEYMYAESGDEDIETGLTGAQLDIYHDEMTHVAHAAALEFVNYLIW